MYITTGESCKWCTWQRIFLWTLENDRHMGPYCVFNILFSVVEYGLFLVVLIYLSHLKMLTMNHTCIIANGIEN